MPLPDMMQAAVAMKSSPAYVITNDQALNKVREVKVVPLTAFG